MASDKAQVRREGIAPNGQRMQERPSKRGKNGQDTDAIAHSKNEDALGRRHKLQQGHSDALNPLPQCSKAIIPLAKRRLQGPHHVCKMLSQRWLLAATTRVRQACLGALVSSQRTASSASPAACQLREFWPHPVTAPTNSSPSTSRAVRRSPEEGRGSATSRSKGYSSTGPFNKQQAAKDADPSDFR